MSMHPARLQIARAEAVLIEVCVACGACLFDYFAAELGSVARALARLGVRPEAAPGLDAAPPSCPDCALELPLVSYLDDGPLIYRCDGCLSVFVTARQLHLLAEFEHTQKASVTVLRAVGERLGVL